MDFMNRGASQAPFRPAASAADEQPKQDSHKSSKKDNQPNGGFSKWLSFALLLAGALLLLALVAFGITAKSGGNSESDLIKTDKYQAVFLNTSDGQVYFGKLAVLNKGYYKLTDIYYVRVQQVQPSDPKQQSQQQISLAKLGSEIHGPEDQMIINKKDVMFWENLKDDGQVVKAIKEYKKNGDKSTTTTDTTNTTTPANNSTTTNP